jgi:hypothetical protein
MTFNISGRSSFAGEIPIKFVSFFSYNQFRFI